MSQIKISIMCAVYNHEKYIRQALDGILMQKTNFDYEVIINDDASTDGSANIIMEYQKLYPDKIKAILREENLYSKGVCWHTKLYKYFRGEYIAICEGDDYWTDPMKLQKQIDLLDKHPEYIGCGHNVHIVDDNGEIQYNTPMGALHYVDNDIIKDISNIYIEGRFVHSCSLVFSKKVLDKVVASHFEQYNNIDIMGDMKLAALLSVNGLFYQFEDIMSCYRHITTHGDSWSASVSNKNIELYRYNGYNQIQNFLNIHYNVKNNYAFLKAHTTNSAIHQYLQNPSADNKYILTQILLDWRL